MLAAFAESAPAPRSNDLSRYNQYYKVATRNANFLLTSLRPDGKLRRSWREGRVTQEVFLEDYAALIFGLLELYQTDFYYQFYTASVDLSDEMIPRFEDETGGFFDTPSDGGALLVRPKDIQDNATPSGNALACEALLKLAALTADNGKYRELAEQSLWIMSEYALKYPTAFGRWLSAADFASGNGKQVAVVGDAKEAAFGTLIQVIRSEYRPGVVVAASPYPPEKAAPALLRDRPLVSNQPTAYVCEGFVCRQPVTSPDDLKIQLK